ncbi:enkurin-like [Protobothrops mucrosquamatus]|uniref:enkurin-like n=1 Tax=Protobothrops mucrosquamatus TaxID=103944 RepID=UPI000775FEA1|nr:enkurin-like [Protobothrops mucrosquamatus]
MEPQESIYHWLPAGEEEPAKPPLRYVSSFRPSLQREMEETRRAPCQTMGIPKLQVPTPKEYLRKHAKERKLPKCTHEHVKRQPIKAQLPLQSDRPLMGIQSEKNFVTANVAEAIMAVAKKPLHACVDQRRGEKFLLDDSGLVQRFLKKKDFGVTPKYIHRRKKEAVDVRKERAAARRECLQKKRLTRLSSREREGILEGLKNNWEEINKDFQSLSVEITTIPQRLRKEKLETEMKQLEHDIAALEKHKFIYIAGE